MAACGMRSGYGAGNPGRLRALQSGPGRPTAVGALVRAARHADGLACLAAVRARPERALAAPSDDDPVRAVPVPAGPALSARQSVARGVDAQELGAASGHRA